MKKLMLVLFSLVVASTAAVAGIGISWTTINGVAWHNADAGVMAGSYTPGESLLDRYNAIWQLIYAGADGSINPASTVAGGLNGDYVTGDDVVWAQRDIPLGGNPSGPAASDGTTWDNWLRVSAVVSTTYGDFLYVDNPAITERVYQRIFEGTPTDGSWYYETDPANLLTLTFGYNAANDTPQDLNVDSSDSLAQPTKQFPAVPEPATMSLLGLGALVMAIRRRRS